MGLTNRTVVGLTRASVAAPTPQGARQATTDLRGRDARLRAGHDEVALTTPADAAALTPADAAAVTTADAVALTPADAATRATSAALTTAISHV